LNQANQRAKNFAAELEREHDELKRKHLIKTAEAERKRAENKKKEDAEFERKLKVKAAEQKAERTVFMI